MWCECLLPPASKDGVAFWRRLLGEDRVNVVMEQRAKRDDDKEIENQEEEEEVPIVLDKAGMNVVYRGLITVEKEGRPNATGRMAKNIYYS